MLLSMKLKSLIAITWGITGQHDHSIVELNSLPLPLVPSHMPDPPPSVSWRQTPALPSHGSCRTCHSNEEERPIFTMLIGMGLLFLSFCGCCFAAAVVSILFPAPVELTRGLRCLRGAKPNFKKCSPGHKSLYTYMDIGCRTPQLLGPRQNVFPRRLHSFSRFQFDELGAEWCK